jgi:sulfite reductase (NADPH) flavoprotein alpha-component
MWRSVHSYIGLGLSCLVMVLSISGAVLATQPILDRITSETGSVDMSVAEALRQIAGSNPGLEGERLQQTSTGQIKLTYAQNNRRLERFVDPATGTFLPERKEPPLYAFMRDLHRSFTLGEDGRLLSAIGAVAMAVLSVTGIVLLLRRVGGWRQMFARTQGRGADAYHSLLGRLLCVPLLITAFTGVWLSGVSFDLISSGSGRAPAYPESLAELDPVSPWALQGLQDIQLADAQDVIFPIPGDWFDVWAVKTDTAYIFIDQFTGDVLSRDTLPFMARVMDLVTVLHTAEGVWPWAIALFFSSMAIPFFAITGAMIWWRNRRQGRGRMRNNAAVGEARALILVGSEGGATWGFAKALHTALHAQGIAVRLAAMNDLRRNYPKLDTLIVLTSTYGDGDAPKSATRFLSLLRKSELAGVAHATLAFGDKAFPEYCGYARHIETRLREKLGAPLTPLFEIDKQSAHAFRHWGGLLSAAIGADLDLAYAPKRPKTSRLHLCVSSAFGATLDASTHVLRFDGRRLPRHRPGDLVGIYPPGSNVPRLYSLGSSSRDDGFLEICVRRVEGGQCSNHLCDLQPGDEIDVAVFRNERFQMPRRRPVVMIGAGTGIAPFTGMIRHNTTRRPVDLFWGGRHPDADALFADEIPHWLGSDRLARFEPAWSRNDPSMYVQDRLRLERPHLIARLKAGATIMVCGGAAMAVAVRTEIDILAAEIGLSANELKRRNRYFEDVY